MKYLLHLDHVPKVSLDNVWLLEARLNAPNIRDLLKNAVEPGDRIFVARIAQNWAGMNMGGKPPFPEWLNARNFGTFGNAPAKEEALLANNL